MEAIVVYGAVMAAVLVPVITVLVSNHRTSNSMFRVYKP